MLIERPIPDDVNTTTLFTEDLPPDIYPEHSTKMSDGHQVGMSWTEANDPSVSRYGMCTVVQRFLLLHLFILPNENVLVLRYNILCYVVYW